MSKFVFIIFPDEAKAYIGTRILRELDTEGSISLYASSVIAKGLDGKLSIERESDHGPLGVVVGILVGGLLGLTAGPVGAVVGAGGGALLGMLGDVANLGISTGFVNAFSKDLLPGKVAVIAEIAEEWVAPLDTRMSAAGGIVHRVGRIYVEAELAEEQAAILQTDLAHLKVEYGQAKAEDKSRVKTRIDEVTAEVHAYADRLNAKLTQFKEESDAKLTALAGQTTKVKGDVRKTIDSRMTLLRAEAKRRSGQLEEAWDLTKKAFAS